MTITNYFVYNETIESKSFPIVGVGFQSLMVFPFWLNPTLIYSKTGFWIIHVFAHFGRIQLYSESFELFKWWRALARVQSNSVKNKKSIVLKVESISIKWKQINRIVSLTETKKTFKFKTWEKHFQPHCIWIWINQLSLQFK